MPGPDRHLFRGPASIPGLATARETVLMTRALADARNVGGPGFAHIPGVTQHEGCSHPDRHLWKVNISLNFCPYKGENPNGSWISTGVLADVLQATPAGGPFSGVF